MYNLVSQSGHITYGIKEYVCDTVADLNTLPIDGKAGSTAYIIEDSTTYILNSKHEWKKKKNFNNGGSNEELEAEIERLQSQNAELTAANEKLISDNASLTSQVSDLSNENGNLKKEVSDMSAVNTALSTENVKLSKENKTLKSQNATLTSENEALKKEIEDLTEFVPSAENNSLSVPATSTMIQDTTLIVSADNSEIIGNKLILD